MEIFVILLIVGLIIKVIFFPKKSATILCIKHVWNEDKNKKLFCRVCGKYPE